MQQGLQDPLAIQRRALDVEDYIDVARRHKEWIIGPLLACLVLGTVVAFLWPDTYVSSAMIRVIPAQVPERYVPSNVNDDIMRRINSINQLVTSRTTLTNVVNLYQLYPRDRNRLPLADIVEQMRKSIKVDFVGQPNPRDPRQQQLQAFQISFAYENRVLAQKIVTELVSRFIDENVRVRTAQSTQTSDFLREQLEQRKRELDSIEEQLTKYRVENQGRLPEERMNLQAAINTLDGRISNLNQQINRANQEKLLHEGRISSLKDQIRQVMAEDNPAQVVAQAKNDRLAALEREVMLAETQLEAMKQNYKETHPDVRRMTSNLESLRKTRDSVMMQDMSRKVESAPQRRNPLAAQTVRGYEADIAALQSMIEARNLEIDNYTKELQSSERNLRAYQGKLEAMPAGLADYEQLIRDRSLAQDKYQEMAKKATSSEDATQVEARKQGENLELLDPASLPLAPSQPKRAIIIGAAAGIGLVLGIILAGAREMKDSTLKNLKDVRAYTQLMVLGSIPLLENDLVIRRRRRLGWLAWSTACLTGVVIMAGSIIFYYSTRV